MSIFGTKLTSDPLSRTILYVSEERKPMTHVLRICAESGVSGSSSPSYALSLMVSGMRQALAFSIPEEDCLALMFPACECLSPPVPSSPVCTNALHRACSVCLLPAPEIYPRAVQVLLPGSHQCAFQISPRCVLQVVQIGGQGNRRIEICSISGELVRAFALDEFHALSAPLSPRNADTTSHMSSPSSSAGGGSIHTLFSVPSGTKRAW